MSSTSEDILRAAMELFSEKGYDATTVRDICSLASANVAAVNYHFKGKIGLGEAVIDYLFENVRDTESSFIRINEIGTEEEWKSAIFNFIYNFIADRDKEGYRNFYRSQLIFLEMNQPSELFKTLFKKYVKPIQKQHMELIRMGLPKDAADEEVTMWVITLMAQCVIFRKKQVPSTELSNLDFSDPENVKKVADHIAGTIFAGLKFRG